MSQYFSSPKIKSIVFSYVLFRFDIPNVNLYYNEHLPKTGIR